MKQVREINVLSKMENIATEPLPLNETSLHSGRKGQTPMLLGLS